MSEIQTAGLLAQVLRASELLEDPEHEYDVRELIDAGGIVGIHDYETMGDRPIGTYDCGSVRLSDTPKALYRAMFVFRPERISFKKMYKDSLLTLVSPDYQLVASLEFYKYELALYFSAAKEHIEGRESGVICGLPGTDNGIRFKGETAQAWFGFVTKLLERQWEVYGGNDFIV